MMTFDERVRAVAKKGFTERQARFLTTVMLHAGVCVPRQYARFCGIVHGEKTRKLFTKLVRLGYASMYDCRHNRLTTLVRIEAGDLPHIAVGQGHARTIRYFPDRLPIGIHPAGRGVVVYVVTDPWLDEFRVFLLRHAALLRALPAWTLRIVVPPQFPDIGQRAKQVVWNQLMTPLEADILDELRWYFEKARSHPAPSRSPDLDERLYRARDAFSSPRFKALYRVWKQDGDAAFDAGTTQALDNAVTAGAGCVESLELGHRYGHLSPLVAVA